MVRLVARSFKPTNSPVVFNGSMSASIIMTRKWVSAKRLTGVVVPVPALGSEVAAAAAGSGNSAVLVHDVTKTLMIPVKFGWPTGFNPR